MSKVKVKIKCIYTKILSTTTCPYVFEISTEENDNPDAYKKFIDSATTHYVKHKEADGNATSYGAFLKHDPSELSENDFTDILNDSTTIVEKL